MKFGVFSNADLAVLKEYLQNKGVKVGRIFNYTKLATDPL
ncbi:MAG: hypothetical protein ACI854_001764 [Arenicella sp.]|jgi:hypothetical protein